MADRRPIRSARLAVALVVAGVSLLIASAVALAASAPAKHARAAAHRHPAPAPPALTGWLAGGVRYPQRAVILTPPPRGTLSPSAISVHENGAPVSGFSLSPLAAGHPGDFGTVVAVDQNSSMSGPGLSAALSAVHRVIAARASQQPLGVITFDATPTRYLPLSSAPAAIDRTLATTPWTGPGADVPSAEQMALQELAGAHFAAGLVIVISDGVGVGAGPQAGALRTAAETAHVPIVTVGLADAHATPRTLRALAAQAPGQYFATQPAGLAALLATIESRAQAGDIVRWRSDAPGGQTATIDLAVKGLRGTITATVADPRPAPTVPVHAAPAPAPVVVHHPAAPKNPRAGLSFSSSFAPQQTLQSAPDLPATGPAPVATPAPPPAQVVTQGFWGSTEASLIVALACGLITGLIVLLILHRPSRRAVRLRVGRFAPTDSDEDGPLLAATQEEGARGPFAAVARSSWWPKFVEAVEVSRSSHTPQSLVKRAALVGLLLGAIGSVLVSPILGFVCLIAWPFALRMWVNRAAGKQRSKFRDTLPVYLQDLASAIRVGRSLVAGLGVLAESAEEPMRSELERAITDEALGRTLEESLELVAKRMESPDMDQVALIAALNRRSGSNIAEALDRVAEGARERADLRREIKALTAQAKMSSLVLTALPGVLLVGLSVLSPKYSFPLFHTTMGIIALVVGACLVAGGWKVMQKITRVEA